MEQLQDALYIIMHFFWWSKFGLIWTACMHGEDTGEMLLLFFYMKPSFTSGC